MPDRNERREIVINKSDFYKKKREEKNLNFFRHYSSLRMSRVTPSDVSDLTVIDHVWSLGDRYHKLAHKYYGDVNLWYLIAWFNRKPTDGHVKLGDTIHVPMPLEKIIYLYNK